MKFVAYIVIAASLVVGVIGAMTAYLPRVDAPGADAELAGLRLNAPAGKTTGEDGQPVPLVADETELKPGDIEQLRAADVKRVRVREFAWGRWSGSWMFLIGCAGLLAGGLYLRISARRLANERALGAGDAPAMDPAAYLDEMRREVRALLEPPAHYQAGLPGAHLDYAGPGTRLAERVMRRIGELQKTTMPAFIAARPQLVARLGLSGYAQLMDAYAAAERALNRAWSAAADDDENEAIHSLERGLALLEESARRLS